MKVALIDGGIDSILYPELIVESDLIVEKDGKVRNRQSKEQVCSAHGTTCARIIHQYAPDVTFCSLEIFDSVEMCGTVVQLLAALNWCYENCIPVIHMSVGSTRFSDYQNIVKMVARLLEHGQIVIAARSNKKQQYTMPACFLGVFGVEYDVSLSKDEYKIAELPEPDGVWVKASSRHRLLDYDGHNEETILANSYAAPTVTARICTILTTVDIGVHQFLNLYQKLGGKQCRDAFPIGMRPDFVSNAIVFDPNEELCDGELLRIGIKNYFTLQTDFLLAIRADLHSSILVLPSGLEKNNTFWVEVCAQSKLRNGIAIAGLAPEWLKKVSPCLTWDEQDRNTLISGMVANCDPFALPIIQIKPWGWPAFKALCSLKAVLEQNGFECVALSDQPKSYLYGVEYISKGQSPEVLISHFNQYIKPDVALCMLSKDFDERPSVLTVLLSTNGQASYHQANNRVEFPLVPTNDDWLKLLSWIS